VTAAGPSAAPDRPVPPAPGGQGFTRSFSALRRLVHVEPQTFARDIWGRAALLSLRKDLPGKLPGELAIRDLFGPDAVDELVSRRGLRTPFLRVAKDGTTVGDAAFTAGGGVGAGIADQVSDDKLLRLFGGGATIVLQGLHRVWPPLVAFSQSLATDLGHPVQVNAYVTPPQSRGFDDHYDVHDVFVLQVDGEKRWRVHEPVHEAPLRDQPWTDHRPAVEAAARTKPVIDVVLRPGDCLYLPRGYLHAATALGETSTHLTFGVHTWTRHHLADELARAALRVLAEDAETRRSLPLGVAVGDARDVAEEVEAVRRTLADALENVATDVVAARLGQRSRASGRAAPVGPLAQLRTAGRIGDPDVRLRLRPHLAAALEVAPDGNGPSRHPVLRSRAGDVDLAESDVPAVERLLTARPTDSAVPTGSPDTVADVLMDLDPDLVRRLVLAGVLVPE
jgi:bifunctional lysine-specific demethylase and histidyl-hydroxylase NO66